MIKEFFKWEEWSGDDSCPIVFYNCTLVKSIGPWPIGTEFDEILIDNINGYIQLYSGGTLLNTYKIHLTIGEEIQCQIL